MSSRYKLQNFIESFLRPYKSKSGNLSLGNHQHQQDAMVTRHHYPVNQGLRFFSSNMGIWRNAKNTKDDKEKSIPPVGPGPSKFSFPVWARWVFGSVLSLFLPFWKDKWAKFKTIEGEAEMVVEQLENVVEVVEKVATVAEKVSAEVAEKLSEDSKLKKAAMVLEHVSEITAQDAHATTEIIHQVEALQHDVDALESLVDPIVSKIEKQESKAK